MLTNFLFECFAQAVFVAAMRSNRIGTTFEHRQMAWTAFDDVCKARHERY